MNTPSHSILNLAILDRAGLKGCTWPILIGSWLPDIAMFVFYGWASWQQLPPATIWQEAYYEPFWQNIFAVGNSIPLAMLGIGWGLWRRQRWAIALFASMLLHHLGDLPLHHEDAHQHFWPLTNYRFVSPVSYWDRDHYGMYGALLELILTAIASLHLLKRLRSTWGKALIISTNCAYLFGYWQLYL
ncbi:MAG: hypothetical protein ACFBSG_13435 [Leptolyngbyaceae cyanobacterium]